MTDMDGLIQNQDGSLFNRKQLGWQPKNMVGTPNPEWLAQTQYGWQPENIVGTPKEEWIPFAE